MHAVELRELGAMHQLRRAPQERTSAHMRHDAATRLMAEHLIHLEKIYTHSLVGALDLQACAAAAHGLVLEDAVGGNTRQLEAGELCCSKAAIAAGGIRQAAGEAQLQVVALQQLRRHT